MLPTLTIRITLNLLIVALAGAWPVTYAAEAPNCPEIRRPNKIVPPLRGAAPEPDLSTRVRARELNSVGGITSEFSGQVEVERDNQVLTADHLFYNSSTDEVDAHGNVTLKDKSGVSFHTPELNLQLNTRLGHSGPSLFRVPSHHARGDAERIDFEGPDHTRLTRLRYTTCAPGQDDWFLKIRELELDTAEDIGTAHHTSVNFKGVPIFYFPYLNFPLSDQRKSGFLTPKIGVSSGLGTQIAAPYYWNLAPNYDATTTPGILSSRGVRLQNELRYLTRHSEGKAQMEFLPNDKGASEADRLAGTYKHKETFSPLWSGNLDLRGVSDKEYINDFGDNLSITSQTHLPQNAGINYRGPLWNFAALAADYQTVDKTVSIASRPYTRLPQLNLTANPPGVSNHLNYYFDSELVNFLHDSPALVAGKRLNLSPAVSLPLSNDYGFFTPRIGARQISYSLSRKTDSTPGFTTGVFSVDSGLIFERDTLWADRQYTQTLEPRLYYLYTPYKNQDNLPVFDTGLAELNFSSLFRDNRFSGGDRVGDANQAAVALTTRFLDDKDGIERLRASVGRLYYMDDQRVNLPPSIHTAASSDIVGEASALLVGNWHARGNLQWNQRKDYAQRYNYYFQYNPEKNRILNFGRRFSRDQLSQADVSTEWPLAGRWTLRARSLYSLKERRNVDSYAGVEYNACCWALRVFATRRLVANNDTPVTVRQAHSIMIEWQLTGLAKLGRAPTSPLKESVFSFPPNPLLPESEGP